ncbi:MAG: metallophosphoesterase, partial [Croceimicrobium sp.]
KLEAPMGKYSILGNHDYGDYTNWPSPEDKLANMDKLYKTHAEIGFDLLRNENRVLERAGDKIRLVGVENWGKGFAQHGDLNAALQGTDPDDFHVLMSHDPSHFDEVVKKHPQKMSLTLSGHTHGMQFGIEIPGVIRWSPVKYRYPKWAGLYEEAGRYLYVNRGFGFLAFPGRVGIWPEITVLEFKKGDTSV